MFRKCTKFVKYEHIKSGKVDNMPEPDWKDIERSKNRSKEFRYIETIDVAGAPRVHNTAQLEVVDDDLLCPLCDMVMRDEEALKAHKLTCESLTSEVSKISGTKKETPEPSKASVTKSQESVK